MCSSSAPKAFPPARLSTGGSVLPASVYASGMAPALTDASTGKQLKPAGQLPSLPGPGTGMPNTTPANPFLSMLAQLGMA